MQQSQISRKVAFRISTDGVLNSKVISPAVSELRKRLFKFSFREGSFAAWATVVGDLNVTFPEPSIAVGTYSLTLEIRDGEYIGSGSRFNQFMMSVLSNRLAEQIRFEINGLKVEMWN